jgi:hypothetical protein
MPGAEVKREVWLALIKKASQKGVEHGLVRSEIQEHVASGLADQYAFTFELISSGTKVTPEKLAVLLAEKGLGIAKLASGDGRYQCGITVMLFGIGFFKSFRAAVAAAATEGLATYLLICEVSELVQTMYELDAKCGVSATARKEAEKRLLPAYTWVENGIFKWISSGGTYSTP